MRAGWLAIAWLLAAGAAAPAAGQDAVAVDPARYKVEVDNDQVRVLRITYGPREKSTMHAHPASVVIFVTDGHVRFTLPDGTTQDATAKAGTVLWDAGGRHRPENLSDRALEVIQVELKGRQAPAR